MIWRLIAVPFLACAVAGCMPPTDLGKPCALIRKDPSDPTGKKSLPIKESDIKPGRDFISFGSVECEDLVCVRDANEPRPAGATDTSDAMGYCSRPCLQTSTTGCPAYESAHDSDPVKRLSCRPLILDEVTLAGICQIDPPTCTKYFGDTKSPYFCARGGSTSDGGTK